ncbi:MAG: efflux RND transporter permease subunit [Dehalococcoidia bacterium]
MRRVVSWLTEYSFRKALLVLVAVALVIGFGAYTITRVREELMPDVSFPVITVIARSPGDQPQNITDTVITPIESAVSGLPGVRKTSSTAVSGLGVTMLSYNYGTDLNAAETAVKQALADARLGSNVSTSILKFDISMIPIVTFSLEGNLSQAELYQLAQSQVVPNLANLDGVASVSVSGGALSNVVVTLDRQKLLDSGLTYDQVAQALEANNVILPSGQLATGDTVLPVETVAVYKSLDDIRNINVRPTPAAGAPTTAARLGDIATVAETSAAPNGASRTDGQPAVSIQVTKAKDANTVQVAHSVTAELDKIEPALPQGASFSVFFDQSTFITSSINGVVRDGLIGGAFAIIIVFLFLANWRTTMVTAVSIPLSVLTAVVLLDRLGYSLNIMTLGGLTIAIGRVIDDSIVVLENIYRHMAKGEKAFNAIVNGAREVSIAITGATATTCAVFLPLGLVGGIIGQLFFSFALAVVFALLASLLVAVTVIPALARFTIAGRVKVRQKAGPGDTPLAKVYTPVLRWALGHRWITLGVAGVMFAGSLALVPTLPIQFLPGSGQKTITVSVDARPGETQDAVLQQAESVEKLLSNFKVDRYQSVINGTAGDLGAVGNVISGKGANSAKITIELAKSGPDKNTVASQLRNLIAKDVPNSDNMSVSAADSSMGTSGISMTVSAASDAAANALPAAAEQVRAAVAAVPNTANVQSDLADAQPTLEVQVDPAKAAAAGLTPQQISGGIANLSSNRTITTADLGQGPIGVTLVVSGGDLNSAETLGALEIARDVRLDSVASIVSVTKQTTITRVDGRPAATISGDITSDNTGKVSQDAQKAVDKLTLPDGISVKAGGIASDINEGFSKMFVAIVVSIVLVYTVMALLFGSLLTPFVILFSLPLALIGAIVALAVTGSALSISSLIGILMLVGIVVTNAIVLLEFVIMLRKERGYSTYDALVEGGQTRVRPIMMTAVAAMLALVPLALGRNQGALIASELGRVVIGGLFTSTLLTLVVVPVVFSLVDGLKMRFSRKPLRERLPNNDG